MIEVTPGISIHESDLSFDFIRSSGPGGQNINKVATGVQLRFDVQASSLPEEVKQRLHDLARSRITGQGVLIIEATQQRTQEQNRQEAVRRLIELVQQAAEPPKVRKATRPSAAARRLRLEAKRRRSQKKQLRQRPRSSEDW
jgi:ribosome-associated protein